MARIGKESVKDLTLNHSQQNKILARAKSISEKVSIMVQLQTISFPLKVVKLHSYSLGGRIIG